MIQKTFFTSVALFIFFANGLSTCLQAAPPIHWAEWKEAHELFERHDYQGALTAFRNHPRETDPYYHYNLGTTYYHLSQLGAALAHFEKANQLSPHQSDILYNLNETRLLLERKLSPHPLDPTSSGLEQIADRIPLDEARATLGLIALLVTLIWIRSYRKTRNLRDTLFQASGYMGMTALTICILLYCAQRWARSSPPAIALEPQVVRSGPGDGYMELGTLPEGVKIRILSNTALVDSTQSPWIQVRFSRNAVGWVKSSALLTL